MNYSEKTLSQKAPNYKVEHAEHVNLMVKLGLGEA